MRNLIFVILILLAGCNPVDVSLNSSAYSNLKYSLQNGKSNLEYTNSNVSKIKLVFQTQDTLTEDISLGLTFISDTLSSDQVFSDFNQSFLAAKNTKNFEWVLNFNSNLPTNQRLKFKIKIKDFNDKIQFTPDSFDFDFAMNFAAPTITNPVANSYINNQNQRTFAIAGSCESDNTVFVRVKGHPNISTSEPCTNGFFDLSLDLSGLEDGVITLETYQTNHYDNSSPISEINYNKDTIVKTIAVSSHTHPLKNSTSYLSNFTITGSALIASAGENESDYRIHLYSDSDCTVKLSDGSISNSGYSLAVNLPNEGQKSFAVRLEEKSGSLLDCTSIGFEYYYTTLEILIGGNFDQYYGESSKNMAQLYSDGSKYSVSSFNIGTGFTISGGGSDDYVRDIISFSTKHLAVGNFTQYNGANANYGQFFYSDGSPYNGVTIPPINGAVKSVATDKLNNIYWGGEFNFTDNGTPIISILKTNSSMVLDTTFAVNVGLTGIFPATTYVRALIADGSNNVYAGGNIYGFIAKLNPNGTENNTFKTNMGIGFDNVVYTMKIISDNSLLVGGDFTSYNGASCPKIAKLSLEGVLDTTFCANMQTLALDNYVLTLTKTSNGTILAGGNFTKSIVALNSNGTINSSYNFGTGFNAPVFVITEFIDGKILIGGDFTTYNGSPQSGLIKINKTGAIDTTFKGNGQIPAGQGVYTIHF